ncbi:MAG TPA: hypothetical protein VNE82_13105 [Candidatus Binataceae bacterium]|nr:hypothetical protein [Candidatus Binataceae bacterium]
MKIEDGSAGPAMRQAEEQGRAAGAKVSQTVKAGYEAAQQYAEDKGLDFDLEGFVRREPWLALAAAFAVGYTVAQIMRRVF